MRRLLHPHVSAVFGAPKVACFTTSESRVGFQYEPIVIGHSMLKSSFAPMERVISRTMVLPKAVGTDSGFHSFVVAKYLPTYRLPRKRQGQENVCGNYALGFRLKPVSFR